MTDNAKELLALAAQIAAPHAPFSFLTRDERKMTIDALRLSARQQASVELVEFLCGDELNGGLLRDICWSVWNLCHNPTHADGNTDWFNDTFPVVQMAVARTRERLAKYDIFEKVEG